MNTVWLFILLRVKLFYKCRDQSKEMKKNIHYYISESQTVTEECLGLIDVYPIFVRKRNMVFKKQTHEEGHKHQHFENVSMEESLIVS